MSKLTIYITRHGKTLMNTLERMQGWCDSPLTKEGIEVAQFLGYGMKDIELQGVYCSTLRRTRDTAQIILQAKGQEDLGIIEKDELKESGFGSFESHDNGEKWREIAIYLQYNNYKDMNRDMANGKLAYSNISNTIAYLDSLGIAEDWNSVVDRTQKVLRELAKKEMKKGSENILVISHGISILAMLGSLGGDKLQQGYLDNASISKVEYEQGKFTVLSMGDMSYVEKGKTEKNK